MKLKVLFFWVVALVLVAGCTVCHPEGDFNSLNNYGKAYNEAGRDTAAVKAIDNADSDGDGISNAEELKAATNPGNAASK